MYKLILPSMVAGRTLANTLVDKFDGDLRDAEVQVDARRLLNASPSFSAELVHRILTVEGARTLQVVRPPRRSWSTSRTLPTGWACATGWF